MCLILDHNARRQRAKRNIPVWKVLHKRFDRHLPRTTTYHSVYYSVRGDWFPGCRRQSKLGEDFEQAPWFTLKYKNIGPGLHAFTTRYAARDWMCQGDHHGSDSMETVIKMMIPKGSYYYVNRNSHEIAATQMRWQCAK